MMNNELIPTPMMSFGESVKTCFQKYVTFKGRARRSEYWWFWLLNLINGRIDATESSCPTP